MLVKHQYEDLRVQDRDTRSPEQVTDLIMTTTTGPRRSASRATRLLAQRQASHPQTTQENRSANLPSLRIVRLAPEVGI